MPDLWAAVLLAYLWQICTAAISLIIVAHMHASVVSNVSKAPSYLLLSSANLLLWRVSSAFTNKHCLRILRQLLSLLFKILSGLIELSIGFTLTEEENVHPVMPFLPAVWQVDNYIQDMNRTWRGLCYWYADCRQAPHVDRNGEAHQIACESHVALSLLQMLFTAVSDKNARRTFHLRCHAASSQFKAGNVCGFEWYWS